ncbi:MAG: GlsB/YeaQ/YmgE family stress response membrane protein [Ktedonobacterales bacterium]
MNAFGSDFGGLVLNPGGCFAWLAAALVAGWLAGLVTRGHGFGCLGDIVLGLVGAFVGLYLLGLYDSLAKTVVFAGEFHFFGTILVAFLGALVLAAIGRLVGGSGRSRRTRTYRQR